MPNGNLKNNLSSDRIELNIRDVLMISLKTELSIRNNRLDVRVSLFSFSKI